MSKKRQKNKSTKKRLPQQIYIKRADKLIAQDKWHDASDLLRELIERDPNQPALYRKWSSVLIQLGDSSGMLEASERWVELSPNDLDAQMQLGEVYLHLNYFAAARHIFLRLQELHPGTSQATTAAQKMKQLALAFDELLQGLGIAEHDNAPALAQLHDRSQIAMQRGQYDLVIEINQELLEQNPTWISPYNNLSLAYFFQGHVEQAIHTCKQLLGELAPNHPHALSNLIHYLCAQGRFEEAKTYSPSLANLPVERLDVWYKQAEAFAYLGEHQNILQVIQSAESNEKWDFVPNKSYLFHLGGVAASELGYERMARDYFESALHANPNQQISLGNMRDFLAPVGERHGSWPFEINHWIPASRWHEFSHKIETASPNDPTEVQEALQEYPEFLSLLPVFLQRGSIEACKIAITLTHMAQLPELLLPLRKFASGKRGSDNTRLSIWNLLIELGQAQYDESLPLYQRGRASTIQIPSFSWTSIPPAPLSKALQPLVNKAQNYAQSGKYGVAERTFHKALAQAPNHPLLLQNLILLYQQRGQEQKLYDTLQTLLTQHPTYFFGVCQYARILLQKDRIEEATELLLSATLPQEFHVSEFRMYCDTQIARFWKQEQDEEAYRWYLLWNTLSPVDDTPLLTHWRSKFFPPQSQPHDDPFAQLPQFETYPHQQ